MESKNKHKYDGKEDRNYYLKPFDDVTDELPQIDEASAAIVDKHDQGTQGEKATRESESQETSGKATEINESDDRDHGDSTRDWDAENNRTGRNK